MCFFSLVEVVWGVWFTQGNVSIFQFWKGDMQQPMQPRCSQHAHPYEAIAIFHPPSFERGRCNNLCNLGVHNMLIHTKLLPFFIHPILKGRDATTYATNMFTTCSSVQSCFHLSSTQFWKGEMQQPMQPKCSRHVHPYKAVATFHPLNFERGRCNSLCNLSVHDMLIHTKMLPPFI
jgi:hypothetical protein